MESNGGGGDDPQRFGRSGQPNPDTNPRRIVRVVNIPTPAEACLRDSLGTKRFAILVPADQPINAGNMGASNVDSSNVNMGNPNLVNNFSTSGYEDPNPTMPNPELPSDHRIYNPPPNSLLTRPGYATNSMEYPTVVSHHFQPPAEHHNLSGLPNNSHYNNAPEPLMVYDGNNIVNTNNVFNPTLVNSEYSTGNYDPNAHNLALNNTYNNVSNRVDGRLATYYVVAQPMNVPINYPNNAAPMERPPLLPPNNTRHIESGNSLPNLTRRHAPIHESISINRSTNFDTIPTESSHIIPENVFRHEENYREPNNSFAPVTIQNMTNFSDGNSVNYVNANNYVLMPDTNPNAVSHPYPYMNAPVHHSYNSESVDATALSNRDLEYDPNASHSHVPGMNSFHPNTHGGGDEFRRR